MNGIYEQRIYMDDVDAMGCVYHANYLKFCERARTEMLRTVGFCHAQMIREGHHFFVMRKTETEYLAPAFLKDILRIETHVKTIGGASVTFEQNIYREQKPIGYVLAYLVYVSSTFKASKIPADLKKVFEPFLK